MSKQKKVFTPSEWTKAIFKFSTKWKDPVTDVPGSAFIRTSNGRWDQETQSDGSVWIRVKNLAEGESEPDTFMKLFPGGKKTYNVLKKEFGITGLVGTVYVNLETREVMSSAVYERKLAEFSTIPHQDAPQMDASIPKD